MDNSSNASVVVDEIAIAAEYGLEFGSGVNPGQLSNPLRQDTDGDQLLDGWVIRSGTFGF